MKKLLALLALLASVSSFAATEFPFLNCKFNQRGSRNSITFQIDADNLKRVFSGLGGVGHAKVNGTLVKSSYIFDGKNSELQIRYLEDDYTHLILMSLESGEGRLDDYTHVSCDAISE